MKYSTILFEDPTSALNSCLWLFKNLRWLTDRNCAHTLRDRIFHALMRGAYGYNMPKTGATIDFHFRISVTPTEGRDKHILIQPLTPWGEQLWKRIRDELVTEDLLR